MDDTNELVDRYVALWNEPDAERRRVAIETLWKEDGAQILQPPQEAREIAARPGLRLTARFEVLGHAALETRAKSVQEEFIARRGFVFRRRDNVERLADVVTFNWEMVSKDGTVAGVGLEFLLLAPDDRIRRDYMFIVG